MYFFRCCVEGETDKCESYQKVRGHIMFDVDRDQVDATRVKDKSNTMWKSGGNIDPDDPWKHPDSKVPKFLAPGTGKVSNFGESSCNSLSVCVSHVSFFYRKPMVLMCLRLGKFWTKNLRRRNPRR